ncbi:hypothetical protein MBAV_006180 [Candidatus Magnetobacterium bavaricum]|uniref:Uncharacterized protein n=1 Tax=Candidatus Magnetobacterium bavaricum TaxID=29290 RepID=A0A0F3GLP1_9BACT|nr:hypothetical protein MBAV_006180 [Candidatus Magnetobacterium bavaricum]
MPIISSYVLTLPYAEIESTNHGHSLHSVSICVIAYFTFTATGIAIVKKKKKTIVATGSSRR